MRIVGHRGASASHPENTLEAFDAAITQGAVGIEFDVRCTEDGVAVVHHDRDLPDGLMIDEIVAAQLPDWVPTLDQTLRLQPAGGSSGEHEGPWLNVEIKNDPTEAGYDEDYKASDATVAAIQARCSEDQTLLGRLVVSSFDLPSLHRVRALDATIPIGLLMSAELAGTDLVSDDRQTVAAAIERAMAEAVELGFVAVHPWDGLVNQRLVAMAQASNLEVNVWTVDDPTRIIELDRLGVTSVITNDPVVAKQALDSVR